MGRITRLVIMLILCCSVFILELLGGYAVESLALIADSFHMLSDVMTLLVAIYSIQLAKKKEWTQQYTYGYQRAEILGALVNGVFLLALCFTILIETIQRFIFPVRIQNPMIILAIGCVGLFVNVIGLFLFHEHAHGPHDHVLPPTTLPQKMSSHHHHYHSHDTDSEENHEINFTRSSDHLAIHDLDSPSSVEPSLAHVHSHSMNMQSVLLHVAGDALASIAVIVSALVIKFATLWENRYLMDPILSLTITVIIVYSTIPLVRKSSLVLLQSVPARIPIDRIRQDILNVFISF